MTSPLEPEIAELSAFAAKLADAAGEVILPQFRAKGRVDNKMAKGGYDPVTQADRGAELKIRELLQQHYPDHSIHGEEFPPHVGSSPYTWVLDPIDGTRAFVMGVPVWSTLIGLLRDGRPLIGVMNQPFVKERFIGSGEGAFLEDATGRHRLKTSDTTKLEDALIATTVPGSDRSGDTYQRYYALEDRAKGFRFGADAYFYCLLAAGHIDIALDAGLGDYDIVALIPIVEAAGGVISTWDGGDPAAGGNVVASATRELHETALEVLAG